MGNRKIVTWLVALPWVGVVVTVVALVSSASPGFKTASTMALGLVGVGMSMLLLAVAQWTMTSLAQRDQALQEASTLAMELQGHMNALDDLAEGLDVGIFLVDSKMKIEYANPKAIALFEFPDPESQTLLAVTLSSPIVSLVESVAQTGVSTKDEIVFEHPTERIMSVVAWRESTDLNRIFVSLYDTTHLRRLERVRRDFVANVSHELRTPLTTIRAMAETLIDDPDDLEMRQKYQERIVAEVDRLTRVAEDLLTLSALEAGQAVKSDVDLAEIARNVVAQTQAKAKKKKLKLNLQAPDKLPLMANDHQMTQVVLNLVDNAINYTQEGSVDVEVNQEGDHAILEVRDTGIGIAVDHQPRIFERFYRVDRGRSRESGGTGLGLSIVRNIVEAHGGKITVSSRLGHGSTFRVYLPLV